jgi:hypothetical protein
METEDLVQNASRCRARYQSNREHRAELAS